MSPRFVFGLAALGLVLATSPARAGGNAAMAQALFDEAKKLMAKNAFATACPKLAESQRLDPSGGTLLHLALCHVGEGKTATAYTELHDAISVARRDGRADREAAAKGHLAKLEPKLSRLTISVPDDARVAGLAVTWDGTAIREPQWGVAFPVDPGEHAVAASAPGRVAWTSQVTVKAGTQPDVLAVPTLAPENAVVDPVPVHPAPASASATASPAPAADTGSSGSARTTGLVLGGVGLAALIVAGIFELRTLSLADERDRAADRGNETQRNAKHESARSSQLVAIIAGAAGVAALGAGAVLFFTSPASRTRSALRISPWAGGLVASGSF